MTPVRTVRVALPAPAAYTVHIGAGILPRLAELALPALPRPPSRAFLCHDAAIPQPRIAEARASLERAGLAVTVEPFRGGESAKDLAAAERLLTALAASRHERWDPVVALGGGVVGDAAGFAAAVYRRGVPLVQCPSTLLAMVDASVGGKTGVNLNLGPARGVLKNLVGAFHQPVAVVADTRLLDSLPERQFRAGLAECVKHALIGEHARDADLFGWMQSSIGHVLARDPATLAELVTRNVSVKARIVEADPSEQQEGATGRYLLNLGHTFAHALEPLPGLSPSGHPDDAPLEHGEAVALGLTAAAACACGLGLVSAAFAAGVAELLGSCGLPTRIAGLPPSAQVLSRMLEDKKTAGGRLRLVLPVGPGRAALFEEPDRAAVGGALDTLRTGVAAG